MPISDARLEGATRATKSWSEMSMSERHNQLVREMQADNPSAWAALKSRKVKE